MYRSIGHKVLGIVGTVVAAGLAVLMLFFADRAERTVLAQNEQTLVKVTESITQALRTVMLAGYADISQDFGDHLQDVADVADLRILRGDGVEAFRDNATIAAVNHALGDQRFRPRAAEKTVPVLPADMPALRAAADRGETVTYYERNAEGARLFTILAPVTSQDACQGCHDDHRPVRGVLKLTTSLAHLDGKIAAGWKTAGGVAAFTVLLILAVVHLLVRRTVVARIDSITAAMRAAAAGDLSHAVPVPGEDELARMARAFNTMMQELTRIYSGLRHEQNKLSTILLGSRDGIVVTNGGGDVVLVNPAAERLLDKSAAQITTDGFLAVVGDPDWVRQRLNVPPDQQRAAVIAYNGRVISAYMASIHTADGELVGSAALMRDVTEQTRLREELERLSVTDGLTGLYNRRYFDQKLNDEFLLALRYSRPLSLLLLDVDHFKRFNDTYGHEQGDRVLQAIAPLLKSLRTTDIPCRYGGEEFVIILPDTPVESAMLAAERLRGAVAETNVDGLKVTVSIGVASRPPLAADRPDDMVKAADTALYASKQGGRNRVTQAAPAEASA